MVTQLDTGIGLGDDDGRSDMPNTGENPPSDPDVVVYGRYYQEPWWYTWGFGGSANEWRGGFLNTAGYDFLNYDTLLSPMSDEELHEVTTNIVRILTIDELKAIEKLWTAIASVTVLIRSLPDNAQIRMPDGSIIEAFDLKALWAKTDFIINEVNYNEYANESGRGEADYNFGDPKVSFNIDTLQAYNLQTDGVISVVLHELGHMTSDSRALINILAVGGYTPNEKLNIERYANDIAHALTNYGGFTVYPWDTYQASGGFSSTPPIVSSQAMFPFDEPLIPEWTIRSFDETTHGNYWLTS